MALHEPGVEVDQVYFPLSGMISMVVVMRDGKAIETATIGREGVVGAMSGLRLHVSQVRAIAQLPTFISKLASTEMRKAVAASKPIADLCIRYNEVLLAQARSSARRASDVIARIRALSRKGGLETAQLDINKAIDDVIALIRREINVHGVSLRLDLGTSLPPVDGDRIQLQQVIMNLLMTASRP